MEPRDFITLAGMVASAIAAYVAAMTRTRLKLQHLEDTKADRDELARAFSGLKEGMYSLERQMTEMDTKLSLLLASRLPRDLLDDSHP
ncbi:MAG: hypothetical protein C4524_08540 [Candidatus Zixiibacteriota bacterium]|nr:MAG: hypothetical protein C4524_08540 [candidate division Zixibacteria bacterium]